MTTTKIVNRYGLEHFYDNAGTHYIVFPKIVNRTDAIRTANKYFKVNSKKLIVNDAHQIGNTIYFDKNFGKPVWAIEVKN